MDKKSVFEQMVELPYLAPYIDVLRTAMELEIFEDLEEKSSAADIAERHLEKHKWDSGRKNLLIL